VGILVAAFVCSGGARGAEPKPVRAFDFKDVIFYNEDDSHRFVLDPAGQMKPERLDMLVDELAGSKVGVMLICCNAKKTAFQSQSWESHCKGFDPAKGYDQPYFRGGKENASFLKWARNQRLMFDLGVDPVGRMVARCREKGIKPWVSMRMNDVHDAPTMASALHSKFWLEHPEYWRFPKRFKAWLDRCLDYGQKPVRDYAMGLVEEVLDRYDIDGFELDWNRFPAHFREGEEDAKAKELTAWIADVRRVVSRAEKKWAHPIALAARVPAQPKIALEMGLDAVTWAKAGHIDHLIVAPFWTTADFDIPVEKWVALLDGTGVGVTAGLEIRIQPYPGAKTLANTAERRRGAAMGALARGSQGIYLFNYFDVGGKMPFLLNEMHSTEALRSKDRSYVVTFVDISSSRTRIPPALPKKLGPGESAQFDIFVGPKPINARGEVSLILAGDGGQAPDGVRVEINSRATAVVDGSSVFRFDGYSFVDGSNEVTVRNEGTSGIAVQSVELSVRFDTK